MNNFLNYFVKPKEVGKCNCNETNEILKDAYAMSILQPLLKDEYLPITGSALRPISLVYVMNEIVINERKEILEYGSGISTVIMARMIKRNKLNSRITTVEHNHTWAQKIKEILEREKLSEIVTVISTDLVAIETDLGIIKWYDEKILRTNFKKRFDLILVDGPPAYTYDKKFSRYPATVNTENFCEDFCLLIDDADRDGEKVIIQLFRERNPNLSFSIVNQNLGVFRSKEKFEPRIL